MRTTYSIKSSIKYPKTNENGENIFNLQDRRQEVETAIEKFNEKHQGNKKLTLNKIDNNMLDITLESAKKLSNDNMGKELTYLSRVLKKEYGWGDFSKYDSAFLSIEDLSIISTKDNGKNMKYNTQSEKKNNKKGNVEIEKQLSKIDKVIEQNDNKAKTTNDTKNKRQYTKKTNITNIEKKDNIKSNNKAVSKIVSLGKEMVKESFGMSISELMVMKNETTAINDMKEIVTNLENMIDLLETSKTTKEVRS